MKRGIIDMFQRMSTTLLQFVLTSCILAGGVYAFGQPESWPAVKYKMSPTVPTATTKATEDVAPEAESVHILVGRSVVINMQARLRRVYISNPAIVESSTTSPTQVVITAKTSGTSNVVFWDESNHSRMLDVFSDIDVSGLRTALEQAYPGQPIQADAEEGRVVLTGMASDKDVADGAMKMAASYSKNVVNALTIAVPPHQKQIMLKVRFAEVDRSKLKSFGINFLSTGAANTPGIISTQQFGGTSLPGVLSGTIGAPTTGTNTSFSVSDLLNIFLFRPDLNLGIAIKDLQQHNVLQILAEPNLLSMSGVPASFLAGGEFPYPVVQGSSPGSYAAVTIQFRPYGVRLNFTGTIEPDNSIRIKVAPEVSSLDYSNAVTISGFTIPALSTRKAETEVELKNGQSFGIAGLLDYTTTVQMSKIPGIGDIPILGQFFRSRQSNHSSTELLVLVTPTIVDPLASKEPVATEPKRSVPNLDDQKFDQDMNPKNNQPTATKQAAKQ
ncbi:MAG: type II and III secretion system protein family protein [Acidobacteriaceae bacterium]